MIKGVLPLWPRFYNFLVTDTDNRVREAAHNVHHQIVQRARRNLAPYLKQLMAPWFTSQYDTYPPAASVACQAFKDAFPPNKFQEAIIFCQEEILSYINDNLLVQTAQTLSAKHSSPEDAEAKHERVIISCLQGYYLYLERVPVEKISDVASLNNNIISNNKFWKFAKHKVPSIRAAWFKVLTVICQKALFLLEGREAQVTATVFNNLEENEPTVLPHVWESALLVVSSISEWWKYINVEKLYLPKLWKILKQGGQGNAVVIYPNLLPFISHLPPSVQDTALDFYDNLFENLRMGLKQKSVIASRSEAAAIVTCLLECLQYVILKKQTEVDVCKTLIKNHLISVIEWCLVEDQPGYKTVFNQVAALIQYWSRNSDSQALISFLEFFFICITNLFSSTIRNLKGSKSNDINSLSSKQLELLQSLKRTHKPKKQAKVQFTSDTESKISESASVNVANADKSYLEKLNRVVYNICDEYVELIEKKQSKALLEHLCSLIIDFDTEMFFEYLKDKLKKHDRSADLIDIYNDVFVKWLYSSELYCKSVVDLIFLLFTYLSEEEKKLILGNLLEVKTEDCLNWCISEALSHPHNRNPLVLEWLRCDKVTAFFVSIVEKQIRDECSPELAVLFKLALTENKNGELFIRNEAISEIIGNLSKAILNPSKHSISIDTCSSLAAYISAIIYTENSLLNYGDTLLLSLFRLSCKNWSETESISCETLWEVNTAWQDAVTILLKGLGKKESESLILKFVGIVEQEFLSNTLNKNYLEHLVEVIVHFLRAAYKSMPLSLSMGLNLFFERPLVSRVDNITELCKIAEYVKGHLSSPYEEIMEWSDVHELEILEYFVWNYLKLNVLASNLNDGNEEYDDDGDDENQEKNNVLILTVIDNIDGEILRNLYDFTIGELFLLNYNNTTYYQDILYYNTLLEDNLKTVLKTLDAETLYKVKSGLENKSLNMAWLWCSTTYNFYTKFSTQQLDLPEVYEKLTNSISKSNILGVLHLMQVFSETLNYDHIRNWLGEVSIIVLRTLMHCSNIDVQIAEGFTKIEQLRNENILQLMCNDFSNTGWRKSEEIIEVVRLCSVLVKNKFSSLSRKHWDFAVLSLVSWSANCLKSRTMYNKCQFQALLIAVTNLYANTNEQIRKVKKENIKNDYINEWEDVLVESIHGDLAQMWLYLSEQLITKQENTISYLPLLQEFGCVIDHINHMFIFKSNDNLPKWTKFLKQSCTLLTCQLPASQLWGYKMLLVLVPGLVEIDNKAVNSNTPHRKGLIFEQFKKKLVKTHEIVNSMLMDFNIAEDNCKVETATDSFTYTLAYLLLWDVLFTLCEHSSTELRYQYADWLRNEDLLRNFLNNLFRLMPSEVLQYSEGKSKCLTEHFLKKPLSNKCYQNTCGSEDIEHYACWLYSSALTQLPALVRQWWTSLDTRVSQVVEKVTSHYLSPHLCLQELNDIMQHQTKFKNMTIKVIPSVREVLAVYTVDEAQMELVITLPPNYPLGSPDVQCNKQIGGTTHKQWLLQFKKCVLHQNGRIWDGLSLWNNNLDKKFDGVEECYICFAVLHSGTYQLPRLSCRTCRKKFHSACLYKWFSTSNKSTCPICRNLF